MVLADDKDKRLSNAERTKLRKQLEDLQAQIARQRDAALKERKRAEIEAAKARKAAAANLDEARKARIRVRRLVGVKEAPAKKEQRVIILRVEKDGKVRTTNLKGATVRSVKGISGGQRLEHLRAAQKHLLAAGQKELAHAVAKRVEQIQAELHKRHQHAKGGTKPHNLDGHLRELSVAIQQLRKQVQVLQKNVEQLKKRK